MLKCSKGHSLAKATCHRKVREVVCDICEEELCQGDDFFQCKGCEYDVCAGCFKSRSAAKVAVSGKFGVLDGKFKQKADKDKKDRDKKAAHTEPTMDADDTRVFAFTGFPPEADPVEAVTLIKEYAHDFLGEFAVVVLGACIVDGEIGVSYPISQGDAIHTKIHELRDTFVYRGVTLTTCDVDMQLFDKFKMPVPPLPSASSSHATPIPASPTRRVTFGITADHSGWSPELEMRRAQVGEVLARPRDAPPPLAAPEVAQDVPEGLGLVLSKLTELTVGVNELRAAQASTVTRADLQEFHEKSNAETRTFVLSQTDPIKESVSLLLKSDAKNVERVRRLETRVEKLESSSPTGPDWSFQKLAVTKFPSTVGLEERLAVMRQFMATNFPNVQAQKIEIIHRGNLQERGKNRTMTPVGLIDVGNADLREHLVKTIEAKNLKISCGGKELTVTRAMTRSADARNKALRNAADALKEQAGLPAKDVVIEWIDSKGRGVKVKGQYAFEQPRGRDIGSFTDAYAHLKLP